MPKGQNNTHNNTMITTTITATGAGTGTKHTHSSARSVDFLFSQERIKNLQVDVYTHTNTGLTGTLTQKHTHSDTCECALRHMLVKHTLSARKNEPSAKRTQDILAIILWPGRGLALALAVIRFLAPCPSPLGILTAGAIKSAGKSEMKRKQAAAADGDRRRREKRNQKEVT